MPESAREATVAEPRSPTGGASHRIPSVLTEAQEETAMSFQVVVHWVCAPCEVEGRDPGTDPSCWNCGHPVTVIARPTIPVAGDGDRDLRSA